LELGGAPARNMVVEIWQADANGIFRHELDPRNTQCDPGFWCWGRARTNGEGWYRLRTVMPGGYEGRLPHINVAILGIGLTRRLVTTIFFTDAPDPVFDCVKQNRERLLPKRETGLGVDTYRFDVILRGEGETPFFLD
jgi:protocatechuate 3,4-dioxygenase beta subunit